MPGGPVRKAPPTPYTSDSDAIEIAFSEGAHKTRKTRELPPPEPKTTREATVSTRRTIRPRRCSPRRDWKGYFQREWSKENSPGSPGNHKAWLPVDGPVASDVESAGGSVQTPRPPCRKAGRTSQHRRETAM